MCSHVFRLLAKFKVPWVLLENVVGLLHWHMKDDPPQPPAVSLIVTELEKLGYLWAHRVVGLTGFGVPQRRRRVFIVASLHGDPRDVLLAPQAVCLGQCVEMHRRRDDDDDTHFDDDGFDDTSIELDFSDPCDPRDPRNTSPNCDSEPPSIAEGPVCIECALDAVASPTDGAGAFETATTGSGKTLCQDLSRIVPKCTHKTRECYECFRTPPFVEPKRVVASVDLAEKRHGPMLDELFTLTTANGKRMCIVESTGDGTGKRGMLHVEDAERLMGLPAGWTEPAYPLQVPGKPIRKIDYGYVSLVTRNGRVIDDDSGDQDDQNTQNAARDRSFQTSQNDFNLASAKRFEKLGIAVAVPQARWIGERLMRPYDLKFGRAGDAVAFRAPVPGGPNTAVGGVADKRDRRVVRANAGLEDTPQSQHESPTPSAGYGGSPDSVTTGVTGRDGLINVRNGRNGRNPNPDPCISDAAAEAAAAASGWPDAAYNVTLMVGTGKQFGSSTRDTSATGLPNWRGRRSLSGCGDSPVIRGFVPLGDFLRRSISESHDCSLKQSLGYVRHLY